MEPIRWRILTEGNGKAFLLCDSIIANHCYYESDENRTIDGKTVYAGNYEYSSIRKWLNEEFYKNAFSALQQALIQTTTVGTDINDQVFLLSYEEVTNSAYGFSSDTSSDDAARRMRTSDYARATGAYTYYYGRNGWWWLRGSAWAVSTDGRANSFVSTVKDTTAGVVPALWISL